MGDGVGGGVDVGEGVGDGVGVGDCVAVGVDVDDGVGGARVNVGVAVGPSTSTPGAEAGSVGDLAWVVPDVGGTGGPN